MSFIVHLNDHPGTGKKTIAIELAKLFNGKVLDNHSVLNPAAEQHPRGTRKYFDAADFFRREAYSAMERELAETPYVLTNFIANEVSDHRRIFNDVTEAAYNAHVTVFPFLLECEQAENERRLVCDGRSTQKKLTDPAHLDAMRQTYSMFRPPGSDVLDVTNMSPREAAIRIADIVQDRLRTLTGISDLRIY